MLQSNIVPARIGPSGTVRISVRGTIFGQNIVNVFWAEISPTGTVTQADLDTWTLAFGTAFKTRFSSQVPSSYTFSGVQSVYFVDGTDTNVLESTQPLSGTGTGGATTNAGAAACISWGSAAYWRGGKPRTYIPINWAGDLASGANATIAGATLTSMTTAATNFRNDVNALTATTIASTLFGFVSFFTANAPRVPPLFIAITSAKVHPRMATQRRRMGKWLA